MERGTMPHGASLHGAASPVDRHWTLFQADELPVIADYSDRRRHSEAPRRHRKVQIAAESSWEAQIYRDGEITIGRRFDTKALAVQWANLERADLENGVSIP